MFGSAAGGPAAIAPQFLREHVRARLKAGTLLHASGRTWIHPAVGDRRCAVCGQAIRAREPECEIEDRVELHAHVRCFEVWVEESRQRARGDRFPGDASAEVRRHAPSAPTRDASIGAP